MAQCAVKKNVLESTYAYSPLPHGSIRLLRIISDSDQYSPLRCHLFDYPLLTSGWRAHFYEALSYAWGSSGETETIYVDGRDLRITVNLHAALLHLRTPLIDRVVWADAVCINQANILERGSQVQMMATIYAKASRVIVWLGKSASESEKAMEEIHEAACQQRAGGKKDEQAGKAILALLQRPWFSRVWVNLSPKRSREKDC